MVVDDLLELLAPRAERRTVSEVCVGLAYTAVRLDDGRCGVAFTFHEDVCEGCTVVKEAGTLAGRPALELAGWVKTLDATSIALGVATLNALADPPASATEADFTELIPVGPEDVVGMVGYFAPLVGMLRERAARLHIFERRPREQGDEHPDWTAPLLLPECDVVIISGTAVINRTIDGLLAHTAKAREVAVLGPSTPLAPEVFAGRGVTLLGGVQVTDAERVLRVVSEGGGTRRFGSAVRKLCVRL
ncbi:MAG: hypothetical protein FJW34_03580 [Acidobacteria bacterium]|nr:hypothetical protein [Acidobacteriota bacterium]